MSQRLARKEKLHAACVAYVDERISFLNETIQETQNSANNESRSSMGDKYETTRSMMHLENEQMSIQLKEAINLKKIIDQIPVVPSKFVVPGALVYTNKGNFYFAISMGKITIGKDDFMAVSIASPLGQAFYEKCKGDTVSVNRTKYTIEKID